jgi:serine/threonine-protein kinase
MIHPSPEQLQRLVADELPSGESRRVAAHVNDCDHCLDALEQLQRPWRSDVRLLAGLLLSPPELASAVHEDRPSAPVGANGSAPAATDTATGDKGPAAHAWPSFSAYDILSRVSSGGMGQIYKARQRSTGRIVALKSLQPRNLHDDGRRREALLRFQTEVEAVSGLHHENIVALYEVGEEGGQPYYSMEWLPAGTLADRLAGKPQPERRAANWLLTLARALRHVHEQGIVHRDLKPANILLHPADEIEDAGSGLARAERSAVPATLKITDFGVAKLMDRVDSTTEPYQCVGTPEYMAPEQAAQGKNGASVGPATDIYSLGVILYEMLTGRPPFQSPEPGEILRQVRHEEPVPPRRLQPRISRDLETICLTCLHKDPRRRYPSAQALADDLQRWLKGKPISMRPAGWLERAGKWARRHPERAALVGVALALIVTLASGSFFQFRSASARYTRQLAASADHQLLLIRYAVAQAGQDPELTRLLQSAEKNPDLLRRYLQQTRHDFARWFTRPGEEPPIINWFVMDATGTILADSYEDPCSVGKNYRFRDYFRGAIPDRAAVDPGRVYVSRVYESEQDARFKFTVICQVGRETPGPLLGASVPVDSRLVALDMKNEPPGVMMVGQRDGNRRIDTEDAPAQPAEFVVVLHRDHQVAGQAPVGLPAGIQEQLAGFANDPSRREATDVLSRNGIWVNFARVGDSPFVIVVEHPYPRMLHWLAEAPAWSVVTASLVLLIAFVLLRMWHRQSGATKVLVESAG